ncbi:MAG TPA: alkaline phosphatase family protein [Bryobacteraceae bacterium]|nr:alkaline phosphatase family protein [Bryobacteraceae bacterium]HPQ14177.1 alkaline phosphatase family protein [Bryobacteraceae bacterium]HPU73159.1 alkaline phosphatase family protein [Bryobacteraceae bacterium]
MTRRLLLSSLLTLVLCPCVPAQEPAKDRIVVVVSLDAFPAFALDDPALPTPTLRRLIREGASVRRMQTVNPSVTWPSHTSMVTGLTPAKHSVVFNGLLVRQGPKSPPRVEPHTDKTKLVRATTVYDLAYRAGLTTAQVDWVAIENAPTITWQFAEWPDPNGAIEREMIAEGVLTEAEVRGFSKANITWRDRIWTEAAVHILQRHKPNLLLYHVLNLDSTQHRYGTGNLAALTGMAYADDSLRRIVDTIEQTGLKDRTTLLVVSDHGCKTARRSIRPNAVLRERGLLRETAGKIECDAWVVPEGGSALVYVTDPANRARLVPELKRAFAGVEGIDRVFEPADYDALGYPSPERNDQGPDLVLAAKDGYSFSGAHTGEAVIDIPPGASPGSHGYLNYDPDMDAILVAWGRGVKRGARLDRARVFDVGPTIARLLGLAMTGVDGRALTELFE